MHMACIPLIYGLILKLSSIVFYNNNSMLFAIPTGFVWKFSNFFMVYGYEYRYNYMQLQLRL